MLLVFFFCTAEIEAPAIEKSRNCLPKISCQKENKKLLKLKFAWKTLGPLLLGHFTSIGTKYILDFFPL